MRRTLPSVDCIVPGTTADGIGSSQTEDRIVAVPADDHVVSRGPHEEVIAVGLTDGSKQIIAHPQPGGQYNDASCLELGDVRLDGLQIQRVVLKTDEVAS